MSSKLFVGGIPYSVSDEDLLNYFKTAGNVISAKIIKDKISGRSRGFGFVEMSTEKEAQNAIDMFNGKDFEGRNLVVSIARPLEERRQNRNQERKGRRFNPRFGRFHK